ncbi:MCE family protein [Pseudonocardiaceae bacterium YIM PH 21723]|nr:MCE family protein [Pseudonocardiaceae bacterium YIM PH 21723]
MTFVDPAGRTTSTSVLAIRGLLYLLVLAILAGLVGARYAGVFRSGLDVTALLSTVGDGLPTGSDVKVRGVLVGTVAEVGDSPTETKRVVKLDLDRESATDIPASVKARVLPANIFGASFVDLVPGDEDGRFLRSGDTIPGDDSTQTVQLQTALDQAKTLLTAVQPGKLNILLTNLAQALEGRGAKLGSLIDQSNVVLRELAPQTPQMGTDIAKLAGSLETLRDTAPELLDAVSGMVTSAKTVVDKQQQLIATLTGAQIAGTTAQGLIRDSAGDTASVLRSAAPLTRVLARRSDHIPIMFRMLSGGVRSMIGIFDDKGIARIDAKLGLVPYPPYTAKDCPRYGELNGPNCGNPEPEPRFPLPVAGTITRQEGPR